MAEFRVRPADPSDASSIHAVARESWSDAYEGIIPGHIQQQAIAAWYSPSALKSSINSPASIFLVAERSHRVVGFINLALLGKALAELTRIYVLPAEQRHGIGIALLKQAFATARKHGVREVSVAVAQRNEKGKAFYERNGFKLSGVRTLELFGTHVQEVTYSQSL